MRVRLTVEFEHDDIEPEQGETPEQWAERRWHEESWYITNCADRSRLVKVEDIGTIAEAHA